MKHDLKWYPYQIATPHELGNPDYGKPFPFCQQFLNQCRKQALLSKYHCQGRSGISLNGEANSRSVCQYVLVGEPTNFSQKRPSHYLNIGSALFQHRGSR